MTLFRHHFLLGIFILLGLAAQAQIPSDPTTWKYEVKKKGNNEYQLIFHLELKDDWHVYSLKPGGDGYELAPTFEFDKNPKATLKGQLTESGTKIVKKLEGIDGPVAFFAGKVDYMQLVKATPGTKIKGKHMYQVCNNSICLPPKDKNFVFEIPAK